MSEKSLFLTVAHSNILTDYFIYTQTRFSTIESRDDDDEMFLHSVKLKSVSDLVFVVVV